MGLYELVDKHWAGFFTLGVVWAVAFAAALAGPKAVRKGRRSKGGLREYAEGLRKVG